MNLLGTQVHVGRFIGYVSTELLGLIGPLRGGWVLPPGRSS